jgi:glycosyltransferase involved in cell wall biosynthesis
VVIGYNEGVRLRAALRAVRECAMHEDDYELIYVDGGSTDASVKVATEMGVDQLLGGERRRRAAENRNLGLAKAQGECVQFLDGDMEMHTVWPLKAMKLLREQEDVACVFGQLEEKRNNVFYDALQLDWDYPEGDSLYCGGAAMWKREPLQALGGFPEDVKYGEEPLLCWRLRNESKLRVWHLHAPMALHDLAYQGFVDYWKRNVRVGESYAEIADRCAGTSEPFWSEEVSANLRWGLALAGAVFVLFFAPGFIKGVAVMAVLGIIARKTWQTHERGCDWEVSLIYAIHTYLAKLGIAYGIAKWQWSKNKQG